jgi:N-acetylmuramoyl-L-alanine amidase
VGVSVIRLADIDCLARTIYGEARGESREGKHAVGRVIVNRWRSKKWFAGDTIEATAMMAWQFSAWNRNDPNRLKLLNATYDDKLLCKCMEAAAAALYSSPHLWLTDDVTHYYADHIRTPNWAEGKTPAGRLGSHIFFAGID